MSCGVTGGQECKPLCLARAQGRGGARRSPVTLPAGATHRSDGRGVDGIAGQGDVLRGGNHLTLGCYVTQVNNRLQPHVPK